MSQCGAESRLPGFTKPRPCWKCPPFHQTVPYARREVFYSLRSLTGRRLGCSEKLDVSGLLPIPLEFRALQRIHGLASKGPDTISTVKQPGARRARGSSPQTPVNNRAVREQNLSEKDLRLSYHSSGRIAPGGSRSKSPDLTKVYRSLPARLPAPAEKSERTKAREAPGIRSTHGSAAVCGRHKGTSMKTHKELTHFAGLDVTDYFEIVRMAALGS
jgi:hypothetical protein